MGLDISMGVEGLTMTPKMEESRTARGESSAKRFVAIGLSRLAFEALAEGDPSGSGHAAARMEGAIRCYLGDRDAERPAWPYPAFLRGSEVQEDAELELSIDGALWQSFEAEAKRQDVSVQRLSEHAAFYLVAELNAGRITQRILDDLESTEAEDDSGH